MATIAATPTIDIFVAFDKWINQRPGLEFANYGDVSAYRSELRSINKQKVRALAALNKAKSFLFDADKMADALKHNFSGRLEWITEPIEITEIDTMLHSRFSYTTGQYWPTEYRQAAAVVLEAYVHSVRPKSTPKPGAKFETINAIKKANFDAGGHWFSKENIAYAKSQVYDRLFYCQDGKVLFVSSEADYEDITRLYTVRSFDPSDASIDTVHGYQAYATRDDAYKAAKQFANMQKVGE